MNGFLIVVTLCFKERPIHSHDNQLRLLLGREVKAKTVIRLITIQVMRKI